MVGEVIETVKIRSILALQKAIRVLYTRRFRRKQRPSRFLPRIAVGFVTGANYRIFSYFSTDRYCKHPG